MSSVRRPLLVLSALLFALGLLLAGLAVTPSPALAQTITNDLTLTATAVSSTEIRLTFSASDTSGVAGDHIQIRYREVGQTSPWDIVLVHITQTAYTVGNLTPATSYEFEANACATQGGRCEQHFPEAATDSATTHDVVPGAHITAADPVTVAEGGTASYTLVLNVQPSGDVTIRVTPGSGSGVTVDTDSVTPGDQDTVTFTSTTWNTAQTVTVTGAQDDDAVDDSGSIGHAIVRASTASEYDNISIDAVNVAVTDDDTAAVRVSQVFLRVDEGQTAFYVVWLDTLPAGSVRITATSDNDAVTVTPAAFTLTRSNWSDGQTVTVRAPHDADAESESVTITHAVVAASSADEYDDVTIDELLVLVSDDESPTDYDVDNDGLIEIATREQLNAVRYDLDGNGLADNAADEAAFARAFPRMMAGSCGDDFVEGTSVEGDPNTTATPCRGYELLNDIALSGSWTPIGGNIGLDVFSGDSFGAIFDGNGHSVSGLRVSLGSRKWVGLFGATSSGATIRRVGLVGVSVVGDSMVGALVGNNAGTVTESYVTGRVSAGSGETSAFIGGLVGNNSGTVSVSYSQAAVSGMSLSGRIGGLVGRNPGTVRDSYASGRGHGTHRRRGSRW